MEQKNASFCHLIDIRDEPARPDLARTGLARSDPAVTLFDGLFLSLLKRLKRFFAFFPYIFGYNSGTT